MALGDLTELQQAQLAVAGKRYDGRDLPAADRISVEGSDEEGFDQSFRGLLELCELLDDEGARAYDVLLYMGDSGTVFEAGSTEVVADIVQCGIQGVDQDLATALETALKGKV
jgi:hypothetical protein